jgi:hypothetical protein
MKTFSSTAFLLLGIFLAGPLVLQAKPSTTSHAFTVEPPDDTYYYEYSEIIFAEDVDQEGNPVGEKTQFSLPIEGPVKITLALYNDAPLLTSEIYVEIYDDSNQMVDQFTLNLREEWNWFKFEVSFDQPGRYTFDIYNEIDVFINSASVEVVR